MWFYCIAFIKFLHDKANKYNAFNSFVHIFKLDTLKMKKYYIIFYIIINFLVLKNLRNYV
jgi:hypothetical protein